MGRKKKSNSIIALLLLVTMLLAGCKPAGEQPGGPEASGTPSAEPTKEQPKPTDGPTKEPEEEKNNDSGAVYDKTAGNIFTEVTGEHALTVGVNQSEPSTTDVIILGDADSEKAHQVIVPAPVRGEDIYGEDYVQMSNSKNYMTFQVAVDPSSYNYITVKMWGGDHGAYSAMILYNENNGTLREQDYGTEWPLLDYLNGEAEQDGTYYYATYRLPINLTFNKTEVTLQLRHYGNVDAYDLNNDGIKYTDTDRLSRRIYRIYSHTDPWYDRAEAGAVGEKKELAEHTYYAKSQQEPAYDAIYRWLNETTETIVSWQLYGEAFEENVAAGKVPEIARGALLKGGRANAEYADMDAFAHAYYSKTLSGNAENIKMMYGMALAYTLEGNTYYQSKELLERMCALWDFYVRAQGTNGGFGSSASDWIGISEQEGKAYNSEGRQVADSIIAAGEKSIAETFVMLYDAVEQAGLLDARIDYNLDGVLEEDETRRAAYYRMFCKGAEWGAEYNHRECVNQDLLNITMLYHFRNAAALLGEAPYTEEYIFERLYAGLGITKHTYQLSDGTQFAHGGWQFSSKSALALETFGNAAGGYCGNYGMNCASILYDFAYLTKDEKIIGQALKSVESNTYFFDLVTGSDGVAVLRKEEVINTRNTYMPGRIAFTPGGQNFLTVALGSEAGKRMLELYLQSGFWKMELAAPSLIGADTFRHLADLVTVEGLKECLQATVLEKDENGISYHYDLGTDYVLPTEEGFGDYVWTDEMARCVVVRNGDEFFRAVLNWRIEYNGKRLYENASVNNVLRVHGQNTNEVYTATVNMKSPFGFGGVYTARYGDYTIIMNSSEEHSYDITLAGSGKDCTVDLVSGQKVSFGEAVTMQPLTTMVLYTNPEGKRVVQPASAIVNPEQEEETEVWDESELEEFTSGVYEIPAELDTFINSTSTSEKYSSEEFIIMGRNREAMLLFDLRQIPEDAKQIVLRTYSHWGPGNELSFSIVEDYQSVNSKVNYLSGIEHSEEVARYHINSESNAEAVADISKSLMTEIDITELVKNYRAEHPLATRICLYIMEPDVSNCTEIWSTENPFGIQYGPTLVVTVE